MSDSRRTDCWGDDASRRDFTEIAAIVEDLLIARFRDGASWRVPEDAVDQTYDKLVDRIVDGSPPDVLRSWAWRVLANLLKSGPARSELRSREMAALPEDVAARDPADEANHPARPANQRQLLEQLGEEVRLALTAAEHTAFRAMLTEPTMAAAAKACGMSKRDLRVRREWIAKKIRRLLRSEGSDPEAERK